MTCELVTNRDGLQTVDRIDETYIVDRSDKHEQRTFRSSTGDGRPAPKFAELTDNVLFGDIWERKELSKRDRSLITVAALVAFNRTDQLRFHLQRAIENGVKKQELIEEITHLAFYSGWPTAVNAVTVGKESLLQVVKRFNARPGERRCLQIEEFLLA